MPPPRSSERQSYRSSREYSDSVSSSRYQHLPQQSFPSQRENQPRPPRTPPLPSSRSYDRRPLPRRDAPLRRNDYSSRRPSDSNPFRRVDRTRTGARRLPERDYSGDRRPARNDRQVWLPPVRNPARYIGSSSERRDSRSSKSRNDNVRYPDRPITPIPASRRDSFRRSRSPVRRDHSPTQNGGSPVPPHREGPRTPPLEHEPASDHSYDPNLPEEEQEIYDIMRQMFKQCYQDDRTIQTNRFVWLKNRMLEVQAEIEELADQQAELDDLELVDSTERQNNPGDVERDLNGDIELDYNEEPDSSYRQQYQHDDSIKSPPPEEA